MEIQKAPVVIVGSGIAGLLSALKLAEAGVKSIVATKTSLTENSSWLAQGGLAACLPHNSDDSVALHVQDTLTAGAGLSEEDVAQSIVSEGYLAVDDLVAFGVPFDRVDGQLAFTREAAHTTKRIIHAGGDATGRSIQDTLIQRVRENDHIRVLEDCVALKLLTLENRCFGVHIVYARPKAKLRQGLLLANHTVLATGGIGRLYAQTTNPAIATGDGVALAYQAGAVIQDMEFVQFHPTAFWSNGSVQFLISEALRGEGGILRNKAGEAFAKRYHPDGEMAPRDVVTRAISEQLLQDNMPYVTLDITHLPDSIIETRFPTILSHCRQFGIDIRCDQIPVAPAAHYGMGGVQVDLLGQTGVENLYAVGEVVSTGLHGANRLASNSLLECVVLARRVAKHIATAPTDIHASIADYLPSLVSEALFIGESDILKQLRQQLCETMWQYAGILRNEDGLKQALTTIEEITCRAIEAHCFECVPHGLEFSKMLTTSRLICEAALSREESRGSHYRTDFPNSSAQPKHSHQQKQQLKQEVIR